RKEILRKIIPDDLTGILYSDHIKGEGVSFYNAAKESGLEGILAKKADSKYEISKRSRNWLKIKTKKTQEAIICGFTEPKGSRDKFGSLVLGVMDEGELVYIGQAGTGFTDSTLKSIYDKLKPFITEKSPFNKKRSEDHTSELQSRENLVCRLLLEKKKKEEKTQADQCIYNKS